jgi:hypothetical protein
VLVAVGSLATGHPAWPIHPAWDFAPLLISILLLLLIRAAGIPFRPIPLLGAFVGGLVLDALTDALGVSMATSIATLIGASALTALRRTRLG